MMNNSGQSCNAPTRMLVPRDEDGRGHRHRQGGGRERPRSAIRTATRRSARWSRETQWNKIQGLIQKGIDEGATLVTGGPGRPEGLDKGYYVQARPCSPTSPTT